MARASWTRRQAALGLGCLLAAPVRAAPDTPLVAAFDAANRIEQVHALVVVRRGRIAKAKAFRGPALDRPVNIKSVSKSLVSALTGIAIFRGELSGTGQRIAPLLRRSVPRRADPRVQLITIGHLLSMRSGLQEVSGAAYGEWVGAKHWIYDALSKPMVADPGTAMLYSTASYHILGAVLAAVAGEDLHQLAGRRLGDPMKIDIPEWARDPQGRYLGGNDMRISPLAMARFGETYRRGGDWDGTRVVPRNWIAESWTPYTRSLESGHGYGYGWFIWSAAGHRVIYARGYGGQMIYIVPDLELTVAVTSDGRLPATLEGHFGALNQLLADRIIPAVAAMA